ncbi:hypothetical protein [Candidatus Parabeggiatoa sp. HSG14]|uniref:hypothetical protein n=1 Tax=Candidatus Parabeggiatoa sp. HSG14 TaxID=3055593 RepID=UPI0025A87393|nr:hypothetical protein [Thiotrichales bacterium HSG14]
MNTQITNAGKKLAALRKRIKKNCVVCDRVIIALKQAKYCSNRCRQRAKYQRLKSIKKESHFS